jgi:hypothetical protein
MPRRITNSNRSAARPKRHRAPRPLPLLGAVPDERTAEAMDDERAAEELIADLLALEEAGLIAPVQLGGALRYAPLDPDNPTAERKLSSETPPTPPAA